MLQLPNLRRRDDKDESNLGKINFTKIAQ